MTQPQVYWLDAQLPPALAPWLTHTFGVEAYSAAYLGLRDAEDEVIFQAARQADAIIISKDSDFLERLVRLGRRRACCTSPVATPPKPASPRFLPSTLPPRSNSF